MSPRENACGPIEARARLNKAHQYFAVAQHAAAAHKHDAAAANAVLAGIAAADTICCLRLSRHSTSTRHDDAADLLATVDRVSSTALRRLLAVRYKAQYDHRPVTSTEAAQAIRRSRQLLDAAEQAFQLVP